MIYSEYTHLVWITIYSRVFRSFKKIARRDIRTMRSQIHSNSFFYRNREFSAGNMTDMDFTGVLLTV